MARRTPPGLCFALHAQRSTLRSQHPLVRRRRRREEKCHVRWELTLQRKPGRLRFGERFGPAREIHAGSGYWSQDSPVQVLGTSEPPTQIWVRWPGGKEISYKLPVPVGEAELDMDGQVRIR